MLIRVLIAMVIIGALAVGGVFFKDYLDQSAKADGLEAKLKNTNNSALVASRQAQSIQSELADIVKRSNEAQAAIDTEKASLMDRVNSNSIVRSILILGETRGVEVIPLSTQDWAAVKIGTHDYSVFRMSIKVSGPPENVVEFIRSLQDSLFQTLVVESVNLNKTAETPPTPDTTATPDTTETPEPEFTPVYTVTSDLKLAIYAR